MRTFTKEIVLLEGQEIELMGWVANRRDHGKIIFIDLRDRTGVVQTVFVPSVKEAYAEAGKLRSEWVVRIRGKIAKRPENMRNPAIPTGDFEIQATELLVLNEAETPAFPLDTDGYDIGEEVRMASRYVDLRRERLHKNIVMRHKIISAIRTFLGGRSFFEIETPMLSKSTPEGARDYLVPSRIYPGKFYALPQSPQQYKQLLMVAGFERYFQIARCFRDEDTRGDRQPEFTQLDMEMSFVKEEEVIALNEELLISLVKELYPEKKIQQIPFPRISYKEAMEKYKTDRPDLREDKNDPNLLAFCWIVDFPFFERVEGPVHPEAAAEGPSRYTFTHNPFSAPKEEHMPWLLKGEHIPEILTTQYDVALNGFEIGGGSIRNYRTEALKAVFKIMGFEEKKIESDFGHMLRALRSGAPPHGGIAWGLDRFVSILQNEPNIREVIAFPKTGDGRDPMMDSPAEVDSKQLKELGLKIEAKKK